MIKCAQSPLSKYAQNHWDLIVLGGGITGAAVAEVAARAGLSCLLLEQRDFAWGASSRSGKWVHGGLRYLKQGQANVTWHSVREREKLCNAAPGLIRLTAMHWPLYRHRKMSEWTIKAGLFLYDLFAGTRRRKTLSQRELKQLFPTLKGNDLKGAVQFYEAQTDDARLTLRVLQAAQKHGAIAMNYTEVSGLLKDPESGSVRGVIAQSKGEDKCYQINAKQVIAATGAWSDRLREGLRERSQQSIRPLRGSHLVFDSAKLPIKHTLATEHPRDKRPSFIAPFQGRVIVGNTDIDHHQDMQKEPRITKEEVQYLLEIVEHNFPKFGIKHEDIISTFSGVRPVVDSGKVDPSKETRDHVIWHEDELIVIGGGKLTTFQHIAIDALKQAQSKFPNIRFTRKENMFDTASLGNNSAKSLAPEQQQTLLGRYGRSAQEMLDQSADNTQHIIPGTQTFWFELIWCATHEQVRHLDDLLLRRTRIGLLLERGGEQFLPDFKKLLQEPLGWSDQRWLEECDRYINIWQTHYSPCDTRPSQEACA
jgi:glycerol-3-phosphate dehydrogenase